jgi:hypothetical protein
MSHKIPTAGVARLTDARRDTKGYGLSQKKGADRRGFRLVKSVAGMRRVRRRGLEKVAWMIAFAAAAHNLVRMRNLGALQSAA